MLNISDHDTEPYDEDAEEHEQSYFDKYKNEDDD